MTACYTSYTDSLLDTKFVFSPMGSGVDSSRHWEALVAGAIPILDRTPEMEGLLSQLPAVLVSDWSEVTPSFLQEQYESLMLLQSPPPVPNSLTPRRIE